MYSIIIILYAIFIVIFLLSDKKYLSVFIEIVNWSLILFLFLSFTIILKSKNINWQSTLMIIEKYFLIQILFFGAFISIFYLMNFFEIIISAKIFLSGFSSISEGVNEPSIIDYNFASLPILFGFIVVCYLLTKPQNRYKVLLYNVLLLLFSTALVLSGSRRVFFILFILFFSLIIIHFIYYFFKIIILKNLTLQTKKYLYLTLLLGLIVVSFFSCSSFKFKNETFNILFPKNNILIKNKITNRLYRYYRYFDQNTNYPEFKTKLWSIYFDPRYPDTWSGTRNFKIAYPLLGENVEIVPKGVKGYLLDASCKPTYYSNIDLYNYYTPLKK